VCVCVCVCVCLCVFRNGKVLQGMFIPLNNSVMKFSCYELSFIIHISMLNSSVINMRNVKVCARSLNYTVCSTMSTIRMCVCVCVCVCV